MKSPVNIKFLDPYEGEAVAILTCGKGSVGIALSLANDGDTEVFMPIADAEKFDKELERTIEAVKNAVRDQARDANC